MIRDQILLDNNFSYLKHRCFYCRSLKHTIKSCNFLHYIPDIEKIVKRHDFYNEEPRRTFFRKPHPRFLKNKIKHDAQKIQQNQEKINLNSTNIWTSRVQLTEWLSPRLNKDSIISDDMEDSNISDPTYLERDLSKEEEKEFTNYIENELNENCKILKKASSTLIIPQQKQESIHTMEKNPKETFLNLNDEAKQENTKNSFEKLKNFKNYYPKTNCSQIIQNIKKIKYFNKRLADMINKKGGEKNLELEIFNKIQKMKKYSIYFDKYKDLINKKFLTKFNIKCPEKHQDDSEKLAASSEKKRNKSFKGFFDSKKMFSEKNLASIINTILQKPKTSISKTRKTITLQKSLFENK